MTNTQSLDILVKDRILTQEACDQAKEWAEDCNKLYRRVDQVAMTGKTIQNVFEKMLGIPEDSLPLFKRSLRPYANL